MKYMHVCRPWDRRKCLQEKLSGKSVRHATRRNPTKYQHCIERLKLSEMDLPPGLPSPKREHILRATSYMDTSTACFCPGCSKNYHSFPIPCSVGTINQRHTLEVPVMVQDRSCVAGLGSMVSRISMQLGRWMKGVWEK